MNRGTWCLLLIVLGSLAAPVESLAKPPAAFAGTWKGRASSTCQPRFVKTDYFNATVRVSADGKSVWDSLSQQTVRNVKTDGDTLTWRGIMPFATRATYTSTLRLRGAKSATFTSKMEAAQPIAGPDIRCSYAGTLSK